MQLEEHFHEVAGTSYTDAHASGFEVLPDDMVIKNFLKESEAERFELKSFPVSEIYTLVIPSEIFLWYRPSRN